GSELLIEQIEELHILRGKFKVKDNGVFKNTLTIGGFGNHRQSVLQRPTDQDLRSRLGFRTSRQSVDERQSRPSRSLYSRLRIFFRDGDKFRILESRPFGQRAVGFDTYGPS